jgi:hypothetical protein
MQQGLVGEHGMWHEVSQSGLECPRDHGHQGLSTAELSDLYTCNVGPSATWERMADRNFARLPRRRLTRTQDTSRGGEDEGAGIITLTYVN